MSYISIVRGPVMTVQGQDAWIIASLGVIMADLLQGNDMTGVLRYFFNLVNNIIIYH